MTASRFLSAASLWTPEWVPSVTAWTEHAPFAFWLIEQLRPAQIVELGTHGGYSYLAMCQAVQKLDLPTRCTAVDTWLGDSQAGWYEGKIFDDLDRENTRQYASFSRLLRATFAEARLQFSPASIDLLHIDGLHTYEAVKNDFENWLPCLSDRGIVLFHDTQERTRDFGVWQLWQELTANHPHFEFHHGHGLGVLSVGKVQARALAALFSLSAEEGDEVRTLYARLGKSLLHPPVKEPVRKPAKPVVSKREKQLQNQVKALDKIVASALAWQRRSWWKRAFHRWRPPRFPKSQKPSPSPLKKLPPTKDVVTERFLTIFNPAYYLSQNPSAADSSLTPLEHYRTLGWKGDFLPHPLFDGPWYRRQNPQVTGEPLQHYLEQGWRERRAPHRYFDPVYYLEKHPTLLAKNQEPLAHYLHWGWKKDWRPCAYGRPDWMRLLPDIRSLLKQREIDLLMGTDFDAWNTNKSPERPSLLLVTHESTRTGAPIILLHLAHHFRQSHHIILIDLRAGSLQDDFAKACDYCISFGDHSPRPPAQLGYCLDLIIESCRPAFAIVNSLVSDCALPMLARRNVPTLFLIHEYAETIKPQSRFAPATFSAGTVVFPAQAVLASALRVYPQLATSQTLVLPQGISLAPKNDDSAASALLRQKISPSDAEKALVVLGMGSVVFRKGVDLFFQCAAHVLSHNPSGSVRFVWIGSGYCPEYEQQFCVYLEDQLKKIVPPGHASILEETTQIHTAYEEADIFFLSSRLDPLPLVAQEAMLHGLPVLCFAETTGLTEFIQENHDETGIGINPYLDVESVSRQIQRLIDAPSLREAVGKKNRQIASERFDFAHYASGIEHVAQAQIRRTQRELHDQQSLREAGVLDLSFLLCPQLPDAWADPEWWYVRTWTTGFNLRKPFPGFHPGVYAEKNLITEVDPLVHFLQAERPAGPWMAPVIRPLTDGLIVLSTEKIALHLHLYYSDMAADIAARLAKNKTPLDLLITVPDEATAALARTLFAPSASAPSSRLEVIIVPNRGRDIGPFLTAGRDFLRRYTIVGHVHTKKSLHSSKGILIQHWSDFLFENTLGGAHPMADSILSAMQREPQIGIVFPDDPGVFDWGKNQGFAEDLAQRLPLELPLPASINFPVGSFFWARTAALEKLFALDLQWHDYPAEPAATDGTLLHALERLFPLVAESAGYRTAVTHVPGFTR